MCTLAQRVSQRLPALHRDRRPLVSDGKDRIFSLIRTNYEIRTNYLTGPFAHLPQIAIENASKD